MDRSALHPPQAQAVSVDGLWVHCTGLDMGATHRRVPLVLDATRPEMTEPLSAWEDMVQQWTQLGGDRVTNEVNEWWASQS